MPALPERERQRILAIAREVRRHVRKESGAYCAPEGLCGEASLAISVRLTRAGIPHEIWGGTWLGPIASRNIDYKPERSNMFDVHMSTTEIDRRQHAWIEFPQYDGMILDVTADQYYRVPPIWFPAKKKWYAGYESFDIQDVFEAVKQESATVGKPLIPLAGPLYRHPLKTAQRKVRRHLKHPPRSCLCHRLKSVDHVRREMVRRLK